MEHTKVKCQSLRELDALVAEKVMGWHRKKMGLDDYLHPLWDFSLGACSYWEPIDHQHLAVADFLPYYSTDIAAAWEIVETMRCRGLDLMIGSLYSDKRYYPYGVTFEYQGTNPRTATGETVSVAICLAALRWQGIEMELAF